MFNGTDYVIQCKCNDKIYSLTVWQVDISLVFDITPNSSTLEAKKRHVGARSRGSIDFKEFLA